MTTAVLQRADAAAAPGQCCQLRDCDDPVAYLASLKVEMLRGSVDVRHIDGRTVGLCDEHTRYIVELCAIPFLANCGSMFRIRVAVIPWPP